MTQKAILLLNLLVLVVNFAVALGATESQAGVLRTTARVAYALPPPPVPAPRPEAPSPPRARLVKYLARVPELERLTEAQVRAMRGAFERACAALSDERALGRGAGALVRRVRQRVEETLRGAAVPEGELLRRLARIVVSSTG